MARATLLESLRLMAWVAGGFAAELCLLAAGSALWVGLPLDGSLVTRPLATAAFVVPVAFLVLAYMVRVARHYWLLVAGFAVPFIVAPGVAGAFLASAGTGAFRYSPATLLDHVFTPAGIAIGVLLTSGAAVLYWLALRRHFRVGDLSRPVSWAARSA